MFDTRRTRVLAYSPYSRYSPYPARCAVSSWSVSPDRSTRALHLCPDSADTSDMAKRRSWGLVDGETGRSRLTEASRRAPRFFGYGLTAISTAPVAISRGWWVVALVSLGLGCAEALDSTAHKRTHPENQAFLGVVLPQIVAAILIAETGGASSPLLVLPLMSVPFYALRFGRGGASCGIALTVLAQVGGSWWGGLHNHGQHLITALCATLAVGVVCVWLLRLEAHWRRRAILDPLTGLLNRRSLSTRLAEIEAQSTQYEATLCAIAIDIDNFKEINDTYGHAHGDRVIAEVAYALRGVLRQFDLAYRVGGEEFLVLVPGANALTGSEIAERVRSNVAEMHSPIAGATVSVGVAAGTGRPLDTAMLINRADLALYRAKSEGRNRVVLDASVLDATAPIGRRSTDRGAPITALPESHP